MVKIQKRLNEAVRAKMASWVRNVCSLDSHIQRTFMTKSQHKQKQGNSGRTILDDL